MRDPSRIYRSATNVMSLLLIVIGVALIVRTIAAGGGAIASGILLGGLFIAAGAIRIYMHTRGRAE